MAATVAINASQNVNAAGFGVSPSGLEFAVEKGAQASRHLIIYNTYEVTAEFSVTSGNPSALIVTPDRGVIEEGGTALVTVTAIGKDVGTAAEEISIGISNYNANSDREVSLSLGTTVAAKITVAKNGSLAANVFVGALLSASIVFAGLAAYYASRKKVRQLLFARA
ncbi:mobile sperm domain-containing protein [Candidatus Woesearchaeota archaeon]|nr:mobile sperm domain-containing protein [Candidatus Woesearchaeota archaeon]